MQNDQDILDRTAQLFDNLVVATWNKSRSCACQKVIIMNLLGHLT